MYIVYDNALYQIYRKHTAVGEVLEKLAHDFENYKKILGVLRDDFFHFIKKVNTQEPINGPSGTRLSELVKHIELEHKQNEFLDVYGEWLRTKCPDLISKLSGLVEEIKKLDPAFGFNMDSMVPSEPSK